jgi:hypothetical protein
MLGPRFATRFSFLVAQIAVAALVFSLKKNPQKLVQNFRNASGIEQAGDL